MRELREENEKLKKVFEAMQGALVKVASDLWYLSGFLKGKPMCQSLRFNLSLQSSILISLIRLIFAFERTCSSSFDSGNYMEMALVSS